VPLALLLLTGIPRSWDAVWREAAPARDDARPLARTALALRWTTALLLLGHGALGALVGKAVLAAQYASVGLPASATATVGWIEIALALAVALRPAPSLLVLVAAWKLASESLWLASGAPVWELIERAGSVAAPLALAALMLRSRLSADRCPSAS
jgi:hypothetical protein